MGVQSFPAATSGVKSVQRGVLNSIAGNTDNITVSAVNMSKAYLSISTIGTQTSSSSRGSDHIYTRLTSSTNIQVVNTGAVAVFNIAWELVEFY